MTRPAAGPYTWARLVADFGRVRAAIRRMEAGVRDAADERTDAEHAGDGLAEAVAMVQALRKDLGLVESALAHELGRAVGKHSGELADGRRYELTRGGDRTAWDHDSWQHDVRREVVNHTLEPYLVPEDAPGCLVRQESGEVVPVRRVIQEALTLAQAVHRAGPPKSTALKPLGLYAGDYSTTTPGPWRLTTTEEK